MEFCPKCGGLMVNQAGKLVCMRCGYSVNSNRNEVVEEKVEEKHEIVVREEDEEKKSYPKVKVFCPKCGHDEALWWVQQTRAADEPPTMFYKCTKCGYTWREY